LGGLRNSITFLTPGATASVKKLNEKGVSRLFQKFFANKSVFYSQCFLYLFQIEADKQVLLSGLIFLSFPLQQPLYTALM